MAVFPGQKLVDLEMRLISRTHPTLNVLKMREECGTSAGRVRDDNEECGTSRTSAGWCGTTVGWVRDGCKTFAGEMQMGVRRVQIGLRLEVQDECGMQSNYRVNLHFPALVPHFQYIKCGMDAGWMRDISTFL